MIIFIFTDMIKSNEDRHRFFNDLNVVEVGIKLVVLTHEVVEGPNLWIETNFHLKIGIMDIGEGPN